MTSLCKKQINNGLSEEGKALYLTCAVHDTHPDAQSCHELGISFE